MLVNGLRTTRETVEIEIDPTHVISRLWEEWRRSVDPKIEGGSDGMWIQGDDIDYHRREDRYKDLRPMTPEESTIDEAYRLIYDRARGKS